MSKISIHDINYQFKNRTKKSVNLFLVAIGLVYLTNLMKMEMELFHLVNSWLKMKLEILVDSWLLSPHSR